MDVVHHTPRLQAWGHPFSPLTPERPDLRSPLLEYGMISRIQPDLSERLIDAREYPDPHILRVNDILNRRSDQLCD